MTSLVERVRIAVGKRVDWSITLLFTAFWLWFAWQHGFQNSPDSWYRGVLAKSILEGHPYVINFRQGWLYDYPMWHPDAAHPPFLPALYALLFLVFGQYISVTNVIVALSAGLLAFPLLRLSRGLTGAPFAGLFVYLLVAFSDRNEFLFEVFAGLSIPVTVALLAAAFYFIWCLVLSGTRRHQIGAVLALACFYYIRPSEQLIFGWLMLSALILGLWLLPRENWNSHATTWGIAGLLALPWALRNMWLFGNPFFTHVTPVFWTDRGHDYWSYHEDIPYPSPASYFATHTLTDFASKIAGGILHYLDTLNATLSGHLPWLALALVYALLVIFLRVKDAKRRYLLFLLFLCIVGYSGLYSMVPVLDHRYMVLPHFVILMSIAGVAFLPSSQASLILRLPLLVVFAFYLVTAQGVFWSQRFGTYLNHSYTNSDQALARDTMIPALRERVGKDEVVLGGLGKVQRLNFATGLSFVEEPDNLYTLKNPAAFFRHYSIRYSLLDVTRLLPDEMIESVELVGNHPLVVIRSEDQSGGARAERAHEGLAAVEGWPQAVASIDRAVRLRRVYVDTYHGTAPSDLGAVTSEADRIELGDSNLVGGRERLMRSGLYVLRYGLGKPRLTEEELTVLEQFAAAGGRLLLLCPAWVPNDYADEAGIDFNRIALRFGALFSPDYAEAPLTTTGLAGTVVGGSLPLEGATFSRLVGPRPVVEFAVDRCGFPIAMGAERGGSRIVLWAHDDLFEPLVSAVPEGRELRARILDWLFAPAEMPSKAEQSP